MKTECEATQRGGQKCKAEAKWWVGDPDDDPQQVCGHHATLARRYGWPVRRDKAAGPSREVVP